MQRPLSIAMIGLRGIPALDGGVERAVEALSGRLAARGHDVTVYGREGYAGGEGTFNGVRQKVTPVISTKHLEAASHTPVALVDALTREHFDVIHLHATGPASLSFLPRLRRVPVVATVQGLDFRREKWGPIASGVLRMSARASVTFPDRTVVVSRELRRWVRETYGRETTYIPNGVDMTDLGAGTPVMGLETDRYILFLGRLVPEKQVHVLIEAFKTLDTDRKLVIAGSSSHSDAYVEELRQAAAGDDRILMLGSRYGPERAWLMRNAAVFVQPSTIEGLPIALLEAMGCDRYVVVSDIPENLEPPTTPRGLLGSAFRAGDSHDLARALREAVARPDRSEIGARAGRWVRDEYDWDKVVRETESVYSAVTSARAAAG